MCLGPQVWPATAETVPTMNVACEVPLAYQAAQTLKRVYGHCCVLNIFLVPSRSIGLRVCSHHKILVSPGEPVELRMVYVRGLLCL